MKQYNFCLLMLLCVGTFFSCTLGMQSKEDWEVFVNTEPLEWSDNYVFSATNEPCSIQIWNSETNKLVKNISLVKGNRALGIMSMAVLDKSIWIIGAGKNYNLIRIDIESGNFEYKDFSFEGYKSKPYHLKTISKEEDGKGTLWVKSYGNPDNGTLFSSFNSDGSLRDTFLIECDITGSEMGVVFVDNKYYMMGGLSDYINPQDKDQYGYYLVNLTDKKYIPIKNGEIFANNIFNKYYTDATITEIITRVKFYKNGLMSVNIASSYIPKLNKNISSRLYYKVKSYEPFEAEYLGIKLDDVSAIEFFEDNSFYYVLTNSQKKEIDSEGLNLTIIDKNTLTTKKSFIEDSNQIFSQNKNNAIWISINSYKYAGNGNYTEIFIPEICKFNRVTGQISVYSQDGIETPISWDR